MPIPKGLAASMERLGVEPDALPVAPATPVVASEPATSTEPVVVVETPPASTTVPTDVSPPAAATPQGDDLGLTYDDDGSNTAAQPDAARALRIAEDALAMRTQAHEETRRQVEVLEAELNRRPRTQPNGIELPEFVVEQLDTEAVPKEAFDQILAVLRPAITSYVQVAVDRAVEAVMGRVDTRVTESAEERERGLFYASVTAEIKDKFGLEFAKVSKSHQFQMFLESRVPGTTLKVGNVLSSAWRLRDSDVIITHMQRFVDSRRGEPTSTTVTAAAGAAPGPQIGRGGAAAPTRYSRAGLHGQMAEARKKRDHAELGRLNAQLDAAEKAGLLTD